MSKAKRITQSKNTTIPTFSDLPPGFTVENHKNGSITQLAAANKSNHLPRYSDVKLKEFKTRLEERKQKELQELAYINDLLCSNDQPGGITEDGGLISNEKEQLQNQKARIITTLSNIDKALVRILNKTYGRCTITETLIPEDRLRAHPWATQCVEAKMQKKK